jgi:hypothetical protein
LHIRLGQLDGIEFPEFFLSIVGNPDGGYISVYPHPGVFTAVKQIFLETCHAPFPES